jgi:hypothetical protein
MGKEILTKLYATCQQQSSSLAQKSDVKVTETLNSALDAQVASPC